MILIAAVNNSWGIGMGNELLYHIPADMKFFREKTKGNIIIVGRKTLESFPNGEPLKFRENIVLTKNPSYKKEGITVLHSTEEVLEYAKKHTDKEIYLCGGAQIYSLLLPCCEKAFITKIDDCKPADKFLPNLDESDEWILTEQSEKISDAGFSFRFLTYVNSHPNSI